MAYTPSSSFDFVAGSPYAPATAFSFTSTLFADLSIGHRWALAASAVGTPFIAQRWGLQSYRIDALLSAQRWHTLAYRYEALPALQEWGLLAQTLAGQNLSQRWAVLAPIFKSHKKRQIWALQVPSFAERPCDGLWLQLNPTFRRTSANQHWALVAPNFVDMMAGMNWGILTLTPGLCRLDARWSLTATAVWSAVITSVTYTLTLTGAVDALPDVVLPMSSYQSRLRSGNPSYLQVVVPNARVWAGAISTRPNGELVISRGVRYSDGAIAVEEIARVALDSIRLDTGAKQSSASLSGHKTTVNSAPKPVTLSGGSYANLSGGKRRYRCSINNSLRPGDTAAIDGVSFVVGEVQHIVSPRSGVMEIAEI